VRSVHRKDKERKGQKRNSNREAKAKESKDKKRHGWKKAIGRKREWSAKTSTKVCGMGQDGGEKKTIKPDVDKNSNRGKKEKKHNQTWGQEKEQAP